MLISQLTFEETLENRGNCKIFLSTRLVPQVYFGANEPKKWLFSNSAHR